MKKNIEKRVVILSHLWPKNPQSSNPLSGIYVYESVAEISKRAKTRVYVPLSLFPRLSEIKKIRFGFLKNLHERIIYSPEGGESLKYFSLIGKHFDSLAIAIAFLFRKREDYDIMHCHTMFPDGMAGMIISSVTRKPFIVTIHGSEVMLIDNRPVDKLLAKVILTKAKEVVSVSLMMKEKILEITKNKAKVKVIRNGISEIFPMAEKKKIILFAGKLTKVKDPLMLIDSFEIFQRGKNGYSLVMAGDGELRSEVEKRIKEKNLTEKVFLIGYVDREKMKKLFSESSILAITSLSEGFPTVIYESLSSGTPIVSFDVGGVKEAVFDGVNGFIVRERNPELFAEALLKAADAEWNREEMRKSAENYTWDKIADEIVRVYQRTQREKGTRY
ncbi:MAG: glycosyltransferase [bacterium]|nr:glycosyltransferase [bacterium]